MDPDQNEEINHVSESSKAPVIRKLMEYRIQIPFPSFHERLLQHHHRRKKGFFERITNIKFVSPLAIFRRTLRRREEISLGVPSPAGVRRRFHINFFRKINLSSSLRIYKEWLSHPMNAALLLWLICVAVSGTMLGLLMLGLINEAFPTKSLRNQWIEINNQILNALFTLMSIYQHPALFHHLFMLCRWSSEDIVALRKLYCKNGVHRWNEWPHMMVVVILLHITCLAQYVLCAVYWEFTHYTRPELLENLLIALGLATPVFAGVYAIYSPLGRDYDTDPNEELHNSTNKVGLNLNGHGIVVEDPEWVGGLFNCFDNKLIAYLSCCCTCCVFGWNVERFGFGNMYVHIITFLLLCLAPFWIFNISAMKIKDYVIGDLLGISGIVLCLFGLIYGGFWRIQMRKRFKIRENRFCFGSASLTDYSLWMFCWSCALAQEVRTGNFYDIEYDSLFRRIREEDEERRPLLSSGDSGDEAMAPPVQPLMKLEDGGGNVVVKSVVPLVEVEVEGGVEDKQVVPLVEVEDG
ncbi:hypothetical protein KSP40_PGU005859 [Platanthera guangdongensis]|uniref:Uncharacterized protein n=1 Tax=Platanthera guangdongensis TaxID=2320717 RepID=A0ABR2LZ75_9ASPA